MPASPPADIKEVVLVGGMTRMPKIQQVVKELLRPRTAQGREPG
jgi:molecular chaperone DnaK (HSP70)